MKNKVMKSVVGIASALALSACPEQYNGFPQPENTVPVNFSIDATNRPGAYEDGDLEWKGGFEFDSTTRKIVADGNWDGPFPALYDDGPWTEGGHEPDGATAGDDIFGVTVFVDVPTEELSFEYGAQRASCQGWIWPGTNGSFTVSPSSTSAVTAEGMTLAAGGTADIKLTIDSAALATGFDAEGPFRVKGTMVTWCEEDAFDDGTHGDEAADDGVYTFTLSESEYAILTSSGVTEEFIWVVNSSEYKNAEGEGETAGVGAQVKIGSGSFATADVQVLENKNTAIAIP